MQTHEQLRVMREALEANGWVRLNGNQWENPEGQWRVQTAYAHREATVKLLFRTLHGQPAWENDAARTYRGADPMQWFVSLSPLLPAGKVFEAKLRK
jgi:hypothetical protein